MLDYIVSCGVYGKRQNYASNTIEKLGGGTKGKWKYLLIRVFLPMESIQNAYPFFYRHKVLLPAFFAWRIAKGLTIRWSSVKSELKALMK